MGHRFPILATLTAVSLLLGGSARADDGEDEPRYWLGEF